MREPEPSSPAHSGSLLVALARLVMSLLRCPSYQALLGSNHDSLYTFMLCLFQLFQHIIKRESAVTCACHKGKMYVRRNREWRVTNCKKDLDFAAVTKVNNVKNRQLFIPFRLFLRSQWSLLKSFWGTTIFLPSSSRWQPVVQKKQDDLLSCSGEISISINNRSPFSF